MPKVIKNREFDVKQIIIIFVAVFAVAFLFFTNVILAVDDNAIYSQCYMGSVCDAGESNCNYTTEIPGKPLEWTLNGYPGGAGNPGCCGDDSSEILMGNYQDVSWAISWGAEILTTPNSCCPSNSYICIDRNGQCNTANRVISNQNPGGDDNHVYCQAIETTNSGWYDCDSLVNEFLSDCGSSICGGAVGVYSGEAGVGEYPNMTTLQCCGDDANEYYNSVDGKCYKSATSAPVCGDNALNSGSEGDSGSSVCNGAWALNLGDSTSMCWKSGRDDPALCCGDDTNEYYNYRNCNISDPVSNPQPYACTTNSNDKACCNDTDCVYNGVCYTEGVINTPAGMQPDYKTYCKDGGKWIDLDNNEDAYFDVCEQGTGYKWLLGALDEVPFGEYTDDFPYGHDILCCGDDPGEQIASYCPGIDTSYYENGGVWYIENSPNPDFARNPGKICCPSGKPFITADWVYIPGWNIWGWMNHRCVASCGAQTPGVPQNLVHLPQPDGNTTGSVSWEWDAPSSGGEVDGYVIYDSNGNSIDTTTLTQYTWSGRVANTQYGIKVAGYNESGIGNFTGVVSAYTSIQRPTALVASNISKTSITVTVQGDIYDPNPAAPINSNPALDYNKNIRFGKNANYSAWQTLINKIKTFSGLSCDTDYQFGVQTRNGNGDEETKFNQNFSTAECDPGNLPPGPFDLTYPGNEATITSLNPTLNWDDSEDPDGDVVSYTVYLCEGAGCTPVLYDNAASSSYGLSGLNYETTYRWNVVATDGQLFTAATNGPFQFVVSEVPPDPTNPTADFTYCKLGATTLKFIDQSTLDEYNTPLESWDWDFGNGAGSSTLQHPIFDFSGATIAGWWDEDWGYRSKIVVNSPYAGSNAPILVKLDSSNFDFNHARTNGEDIRFVDFDENVLPYEIESWNEGGESYVWVKTVSLAGSGDDDYFYIYYGNDGASDSQNSAAVWDSDYVLVYHLDETSGNHQDSTVNNNDTVTTIVTGQGTATGQANGADDFNGAGDYLIRTATGSINNLGKITIEAWVNPDASIISDQYIYDRATEVLFRGTDFIQFYIGSSTGGKWRTNNNVLNAGVWNYVVVTYDYGSTANDPKIYVNGSSLAVIESTPPSGTQVLDTSDLYIASRVGTSRYFDGQFDEFRISKKVRSAEEIALQYCSLTQSCITYEAEESFNPYQVTLTVTDTEGDWDDYYESIDIETAPTCDYNLNEVQAINCKALDLYWEAPSYWTPDSYSIYYSDSGASGPWTLLDTITGTSYSHYSETEIDELTQYWYYVTTNPFSLNNSTVSPVCSGGFTAGGNVCPLSDTTPACPSPTEGLSISRQCGSLNIGWDDSGAFAYRVFKCINNHPNRCLDRDYFVSNYTELDINYSCNSGTCTVVDNEILPVNISNPPNKSYYCYQVINQSEEGGAWTDVPNTDPVCDYSYCYRAPSWRER